MNFKYFWLGFISDFNIRISDLNINGGEGLFLFRLFHGTEVFFHYLLGVQPKGLGIVF